MATFEIKYAVGDVVYFAGTTTESRRHPCPDCKGERKWKATSPAGTEYEFPCPRCAASYNSDRDITLDYTAHAPSVRRLTIGSVKYNSEPGYDHGASYMCVETGVGSGSVYYERDLYETEEAAMAAAQAKADLSNSTIKWVAELYNKSLTISDYQLDNATLKLSKEAQSRAWSMIYNIGALFSQIEEAENKTAILELVEDYRKYSWDSDKREADLSKAAA